MIPPLKLIRKSKKNTPEKISRPDSGKKESISSTTKKSRPNSRDYEKKFSKTSTQDLYKNKFYQEY